jgi:tetratricopeptide (TPR) repeat protein
MKLLSCLIITCSVSTLSSFGQSTLSHYFDENSIPVFNFEKHLDIPFKWDMTGNIQVAFNEGLNYLDEGNLELAVRNFDDVVRLDSLFWLSYYYRGISNKELRNYKLAEKDLLTAKHMKPDQSQILRKDRSEEEIPCRSKSSGGDQFQRLQTTLRGPQKQLKDLADAATSSGRFSCHCVTFLTQKPAGTSIVKGL